MEQEKALDGGFAAWTILSYHRQALDCDNYVRLQQ